MSLSTLWHRAWASFLTRFFRLGEIQEELERTRARYLDARSWARMTGVTEKQAAEQLAEGVEQGRFKKRLLYEGTDAPAPFLVSEDHLGKHIRLADLGFFGGEDREVEVSPYRTREVFVAAQD